MSLTLVLLHKNNVFKDGIIAMDRLSELQVNTDFEKVGIVVAASDSGILQIAGLTEMQAGDCIVFETGAIAVVCGRGSEGLVLAELVHTRESFSVGARVFYLEMCDARFKRYALTNGSVAMDYYTMALLIIWYYGFMKRMKMWLYIRWRTRDPRQLRWSVYGYYFWRVTCWMFFPAPPTPPVP